MRKKILSLILLVTVCISGCGLSSSKGSSSGGGGVKILFTYSQEEDTPAATMPDQVSERVKTTRRNKLMKLQQGIAFEAAKNMIGRTVDAVIEGKIVDDEAGSLDGFTYVARTYKDAPDIDGYVFVSGVQRDLMTGAFIKVHITGSNEYDLIGEEANEFTE